MCKDRPVPARENFFPTIPWIQKFTALTLDLGAFSGHHVDAACLWRFTLNPSHKLISPAVVSSCYFAVFCALKVLTEEQTKWRRNKKVNGKNVMESIVTRKIQGLESREEYIGMYWCPKEATQGRVCIVLTFLFAWVTTFRAGRHKLLGQPLQPRPPLLRTPNPGHNWNF